jgi:hypothetical protein
MRSKSVTPFTYIQFQSWLARMRASRSAMPPSTSVCASAARSSPTSGLRVWRAGRGAVAWSRLRAMLMAVQGFPQGARPKDLTPDRAGVSKAWRPTYLV